MEATLIASPELRLPSGPPRSGGIHQSSVIRAIATETKILNAKWVEDLSLIDRSSAGWWEGLEEDSKLRIAIGLAWEEWYIPQLPEVIDHPREMCVEGVYMTPDGEALDVIITGCQPPSYELVIHEVKTTYKSIRTVAPRQLLKYRPGMALVEDGPLAAEAKAEWDRTPQDLAGEWLWLAQTKGYCKGVGARFAYLHVLFLCGDYSFPIRPRLMVWRIEYTPQEIQEHWELMIDYIAHRRQLAEEGGEPL